MTHSEDYATIGAFITGVDQVARTAEAKWGIDRLPLLVDDELRAKFERQKAKWRSALEAFYDASVITRSILDAAISSSQAMQRAWAALDQAATTAGHGPVSPEVWEAKLADGKVVAIVRTTAEACALTQSGRYLVCYTLTEIATVLDALPELVGRAKAVFPGATVVPAKRVDRSWQRDGDALPF